MTEPQGEMAQYIISLGSEEEDDPDTCEECDELIEDCVCGDEEEEGP